MIKYFRVDLEQSLSAGVQAAPLTAMIYTMIVAYAIRDDITNVFTTIQTIHDSSMYF